MSSRTESLFLLFAVMKRFSKKKKVSEGATRRWVQPILLDPCGRPVFPIVLDGLTVYSLGEVRDVPCYNGLQLPACPDSHRLLGVVVVVHRFFFNIYFPLDVLHFSHRSYPTAVASMTGPPFIPSASAAREFTSV